jgi:hypothetical protein
MIPLLVMFAASTAAAQPPSPRMRGVVHQQLLALLNPMGLEHTARFGARGLLGDQNELLFMGAHVDTGIVSYVSPVYAIQGGYVQVSPLSFLVLRAEVTGHVVWPIGMSGAGYYALQSYQDDVRPSALTAERGEVATGWSMRLSGTLQGLVPIASDVRILAASELTVQHAALGHGSHYYDMKWDLVLAQRDWVLINGAAVLLELDTDPSTRVRFGVYDDVRYVPASGYVGHQVGPLATLTFRQPAPEIPSLTIFVRGGYHTHHVIRADELTILGGVAVSYDLGPVRVP